MHVDVLVSSEISDAQKTQPPPGELSGGSRWSARGVCKFQQTVFPSSRFISKAFFIPLPLLLRLSCSSSAVVELHKYEAD